jgi:hypothetical protein
MGIKIQTFWHPSDWAWIIGSWSYRGVIRLGPFQILRTARKPRNRA